MAVEQILIHLSTWLFAGAAGTFIYCFGRTQRRSGLEKMAFALFLAATIVISGAILMAFDRLPSRSLSALMLTSAIGWISVATYLRLKISQLGTFVAPLITLILLLQMFFSPAQPPASVDSWGEMAKLVHVATSVVGEGFAIVCCVVSGLYLLQQRALKDRQVTRFGQLPIKNLSTWLEVSLWFGFIFLGLGLLTGAYYTQVYIGHTDGELLFKIFWALIVWSWYLATLLARQVWSRPSRTIATMCLWGFLPLSITFFGMALLR